MARLVGLTVEIGGNAKNLNNALKEPVKSATELQSKLKEVNQALKFDPTNTELLTQKQTLLKESIGKSEEKLKLLKQAQKEFKESGGDLNSKAYIELEKDIAKTESTLKSLKEQQTNYNASIEAMQTKLNNVGDKASNLGNKLMPASVAASAVTASSIKMASNFEDAMAKVNTIADTTQVPLDDLQKAIIDLSNETGISSAEIADNVYNAISAGQQTGDAVNFVSNSSKLAKAGFADAGASLDILTSIMNAYGLEANQVNKVSDILIQTQNKGKTTVAELSSSMGKIIPTAKMYGVNLENVSSGYAKMTANGIATAETTTYMNSMINELGKSGTQVSKILQSETGKSFGELMNSGKSLADVLDIVSKGAEKQGKAFGDVWSSSEGLKAATVLLGESSTDFNGILNDMQNSTGATDEAFEKLNTSSTKAKKALNQIKNTGIQLGASMISILAPALDAIAQGASALANWFSGLDPILQNIIATAVLLVSASAPILILIGKMATGASALIGVMAKISPLFSSISRVATTAFGILKTVALGAFNAILAHPIIAGITAIIAIIVALYTKCEWFRDMVNGVLADLGKIVGECFNGIKTFLFKTVPETINSVVKWFQELPGRIIQAIVELPGKLENFGFEMLNHFVSGIMQMFCVPEEKAQQIADGIIGIFKSFPEKFLNWGKEMIENLGKGIEAAKDWVVGKAAGIADGIASFLHFTRPDEGPLRDYETWMPDFIQGMAKGIKDNMGTIKNAVSGITSTLIIDPVQANNAMKQSNGTQATDAGLLNSLVNKISDLTNSNVNTGNTVIPVYIGNRLLDEIIIDSNARHIVKSGGR